MRRSPPTFQPGPLTRTQAEALNQLARDLYGSLLDRFSAAPPLQVRQGLDGVAFSIQTTALASTLVSGGLVGGPGGGATIEVREQDLTPDLTGISILTFRQMDGLSVTAGGVGEAVIGLGTTDPDASLSVRGYVSLTDQNLGAGRKAVPDKFGVGVGATAILANSALDVRGYTYAYFAGAISFGGGNAPASESAGAVLAYLAGAAPQVSLTFATADYTSGKVGGVVIQGNAQKLRLRHKTAAVVGYGYFNDDTSVSEDGGSVVTGGLTFKGGLYMGGSSTITTGSTMVSGGTSGSILRTGSGGTLDQTSFADADNVIGAQVFGA